MNNDDRTFGTSEDSYKRDAEASGLTEEGQREAALKKQEIAQTRADMSGTIDQIHGKLNPTVLKEQAMDQFMEAKEKIKAEIKAELAEAKAAVRGATIGRVENMVHSTSDTVRHTGASFADTVKRNPIPAAMIGVGAAWLLMRSRNGGMMRRRATEYDYDDYNLAHEPGEYGGQYGGQRSGELAEQARELGRGAGREASRIRQMAGERMQAGRQRAQAAGERVQRWKQDMQERGRQLEYRAEGAFQDNPLLIGAGVLAAGMLLGLAIPTTRREGALMGRARDGLMERAQVKVQGVLDKAQGAAQKIGELGEDMSRARGGGNGGNQPMGGSMGGSPSTPR